MYYLPVIGGLWDIPLGSTSFTTCDISTLPGDDTIGAGASRACKVYCKNV